MLENMEYSLENPSVHNLELIYVIFLIINYKSKNRYGFFVRNKYKMMKVFRRNNI